MTIIQETTDEPQVAHIGSARHGMRNTMVALGLLAMLAILLKVYWPSAGVDSHVSGELTQFRLAMFNRCGGPQYDGEISSQLAQKYAASDRMRTMVVKQFHQLQSGNANCEEVRSALQTVDYPNN